MKIAAVVDEKNLVEAKTLSALGEFSNLMLAKTERADAQYLTADKSQFQIQTSDQNFEKAIAWSQVAADQFLMDLGGEGIIAGLPWFKEYWGRDLFISFRGAVLGTKKYDMAKKILRTAAQKIDRDETSTTFGRVPNIIRSGAASKYNTADATPWFLVALVEYVKASGDVKFFEEMLPVVKLVVKGERTRTDEFGFSLHGDQETWMDGQLNYQVDGRNIAVTCSPRGNRAVEVQALWFSAYTGLSQIAVESEFSAEVLDYAALLQKNFIPQFWDTRRNTLFDHIKVDGKKDETMRPNALFAITAPFAKLLTAEQEKAVVEKLLEYEVITSWGVRSLSPRSSFYNPYAWQLGRGFCNSWVCAGVVSFHPWHDYGTHVGPDHSDWSYHNGDVWHWLSGPAVEALLKVGRRAEAKQLLDSMTNHILNGQTLGTLAEIMDGDAGGSLYGNDKGAYAQAWSVAEFLRVSKMYLEGE